MSPSQAESGFLHWLQATRERDPRALKSGLSDNAGVEALATDALAYAQEKYRLVGAARFEPALQCARGCHYCCTLPVICTVPEVLKAWNHAAAHLAPGQLARVREAGVAAGAAYPDYAVAQAPDYTPIRCPLLMEDACSVYDARPLCCRGWNSCDVGPCRTACEQGPASAKVPVNGVIRTVFGNAGNALSRGLFNLELEPLVFLAPALGVFARAGEESALMARWLAGEPVFAPAAIPDSRP
jgi:uncharacterized protein